VLLQAGQVERPAGLRDIVSQGPGEGTLSLGELETRKGRVQVRTASWRRTVRIGDHGPLSCNDSQQLTLGSPLATSDARPDRAGGQIGVAWGHQRGV
jgi:hypothetical protein